ncbi:hypothetical protein AK812_SmicGene21644 [Symbiodinium microadriaticum]|uniref:Uncharacterized protein n=1 Tax=Symbiodinium microadriaticum TaxID=2951 RepID=A0A1Q9DLT1_SYMMI|nr:hypothetical protein AK812_SmicGene21644 [Symbiodinium microadriaticum]
MASKGDRSHCSEIYFKLRLGAEVHQTQATRVKANSPAKMLGIYQSASFETIVPGAHELIVQAFAKGNFSDTLLGECKFDLEDRWLALKWKENPLSGHLYAVEGPGAEAKDGSTMKPPAKGPKAEAKDGSTMQPPPKGALASRFESMHEALATGRLAWPVRMAFAKGNFSDTLLGECKFDLEASVQ